MRRTKVMLLKDVPKLGFEGEKAFVKPSYAISYLVPKKLAVIATDPRYAALEKGIDMEILKEKQEQRLYDIFVERLKNVKLSFNRPVSKINRAVTLIPVTPEEVMEGLEQRYGMALKENDLKMSQELGTIGEHLLSASFYSDRFQQSFNFNLEVSIRERKTAI